MSEKKHWPYQNWWECEPGGAVSAEELYQAFKERLMAELVAQKTLDAQPYMSNFVEHFPLVDKDAK